MLRRQARLRREYLYRKSAEEKQKSIQAKKDQLKKSLEENIPIHGDLRKEAIALQRRIEFEDKGKFVNVCFYSSFSFLQIKCYNIFATLQHYHTMFCFKVCYIT